MVRTTNGDSLFLLVLYDFSDCHFLILNRTRKSKKFKTEIKTEKSLRFEPHCPIWFGSKTGLFIIKIKFLFERRPVCVLCMRALFIIKCHVLIDRCSEFVFGAVFRSIEFLSLQACKERFHY